MKPSASAGAMPAFCGSSPVLTWTRQRGSRPLRARSRASAAARLSRSTVSITSNSPTASRTLLVCSGPIRCSCRSGQRARSAGHFACASWTRFSPNTRWPASSAAAARSALWVFETATSSTPAGSRPAARALSAMRARTPVSAAAIAATVSASGAGGLEAGGLPDRLSFMGSADALASFQDFLAPVTVEDFRRNYLDRAPLHVAGAPDKFAAVMSWGELNRLLDMTAIWSSQSLQLALDCQLIAPERYCRRGRDRQGRVAWLPQPALVRGLLRQGASILLNDIDTLGPGLRAVAGLLEQALGAKVQINLYCSWRERQAFPSHFDTHDVFALQIAGEKRWTVFQGRFEQPIAHPSFNT